MLVKYLGYADESHLLPEETIGGQMAEPLGVQVTWNKANNWIIDTDDDAYADVDPEFWTALTETFPESWRDVTDYKRIPLNMHQKTFLSMKEGQQMTVQEEEAAAEARRQELADSLAADVAASNALVDLGDLDGLSKDDLLDRADEVGAEVKASWTKEKIADAIRDHISENAVASPVAINTSPLGSTPAPVSSSGGSTAETSTVGGSTASNP